MQTVRPFGKSQSAQESVRRRQVEAGRLARPSQVLELDQERTEMVARLWLPEATEAAPVGRANPWKWATLVAAMGVGVLAAIAAVVLR